MAKISPKENGPLIVEGVSQLETTSGGPIQTDKPVYGLCRCGQSKNKPYCDGSHVAAGFTSDNGEAKIRNTPISYKGEVDGKQVTVSYTPVLCGHIAECQHLGKEVFDPSKKPWIQPENGSTDSITSVVRSCPSGALRIAIEDETEHHLYDDNAGITIAKNGPYIVKQVELDAQFNGAGASEKKYILCRCGQSKNKPFCDGTHHDVKWRD